jgi:hypothetical protein
MTKLKVLHTSGRQEENVQYKPQRFIITLANDRYFLLDIISIQQPNELWKQKGQQKSKQQQAEDQQQWL